jgi:hypothetical protein
MRWFYIEKISSQHKVDDLSLSLGPCINNSNEISVNVFVFQTSETLLFKDVVMNFFLS